jgi:signal transduction histidine kinase
MGAPVVVSQGVEGWRRRIDRRLRLLPYAALAGATLLVLVAGKPLAHAPLPITLAVAAATLLWQLGMVTLRRDFDADMRLQIVYFVGLLALSAVLIWCNTLFGFFAWTGYLYVAGFRGRWQFAGAAAVAVLTASSQIGGFQQLDKTSTWGTYAIVLAFNVVIASAMTKLASVINAQSNRRQEMIEELAETNAKLEAAVRENAGLHAQLLTQAREAGVLDERQRLAGEIHDVLAQGLTGIVTQLEAADAAATRPTDWRRHLAAAKQLARDSLTEARRSVQALRPQPLAGAALPEAIAEVVDGWTQITGVTAELITTGTALPLLPEIEATLLRTAQEALANVGKHANAARVTLTLSYMEDLVTLDVRDDGAGFDPAAPLAEDYEGGYGLAAMRERLLRIAGSLEVESEPGGGTAVSACVPAISVRAAA